MEKWLSFLQSHSEILTGAAMVVLGLVLTIILARILRQIKRLNRSLLSITENVQAYFDVIMSDEPQSQEEMQAYKGQTQNAVQSSVVSGAESRIEQERKKQEDEAVFNAVLQEYFS